MAKLILFSAPSGSGKSTIINYLLQKNLGLEFSVSATSRPPRGTEKNGVEYYFFSPEKFKSLIDQDAFIEYEEVYKDRFYGTLKSEIDRINQKGNVALFDVDVKGGMNIKKLYGDSALSIFVMPPSIDELRRRLIQRATDSDSVIQERVAKAEWEMSFAHKFDIQILNDDLQQAQQKTFEIITTFLEK